MGSVIKKRRKRMSKKKHRKLLRKTRHQRKWSSGAYEAFAKQNPATPFGARDFCYAKTHLLELVMTRGPFGSPTMT